MKDRTLTCYLGKIAGSITTPILIPDLNTQFKGNIALLELEDHKSEKRDKNSLPSLNPIFTFVVN